MNAQSFSSHSTCAPAIELVGVSKRYKGALAVDDLSFVVEPGSITGFLGPNGAGKTTTIRMIMSIIKPDVGAVSVLGGGALAHKDRIGYLPEERGVYRKMRARDFIAYIGRLKGMKSADAKREASVWLERLELSDAAMRKCEALSKGMQQKVQVAATLVHKPELVILDEPFSGLDPVNRILLRDVVAGLAEDGVTVVFSTHVLAHAEEVCDRVVMLSRGKKVAEGTVDEVRSTFGKEVLEVEVGGEGGVAVDVQPWEALFAQTPGVLGVEVNVERGVRTVGAHLKDDVDRGRLLAQCAELGQGVGVNVRRVEVRRSSLEDVFVELVGKSSADSQAQTRVDEVGSGGAS